MTKPIKHFMVDIETCATSTNAVVWSVGIQEFEIFNNSTIMVDEGDFFFMNPYEQAELVVLDALGMDYSTVEWTKEHGDKENFALWLEAWDLNSATVASGTHTTLGLMELWQHFKRLGDDNPDILFWAKGTMFDMSILKHQFSCINAREPWHYRSPTCMRTLGVLLRMHGIELPKASGGHNALADARAQIALLGDQMKALAIHGVIPRGAAV